MTVPVLAVVRSMLIDGTTTTDSSVEVLLHRVPRRRHRQLQIVEGAVALFLVQLRRESGPELVAVSCAHLIHCGHMLWTRTVRLNPLGCTSPTASATADVLDGGEDAVGDQHLPGPASEHSRAARLVTLPMAA